jgi:hypothetical protein
MPSGQVITSHDFFGASTVADTVQVLIDQSGRGDGGAKWSYAGNVSGMYWANLFNHPEQSRSSELYLLGVSSGDAAKIRHITISRSDDLGVTWTTPSILFESNTSRIYHCAPTPTLHASDGRLYRAFETDARDSSALIISTMNSVNADTDLLSPSSWRMSPFVTLNASMIPPNWGEKSRFGWQEGNAVQWNETMYDILRIDGQTNITHNKAAVLRMDMATMSFEFDRMIDFPATSSKFVIRKDPLSKSFLSLSTDVIPLAVKIGTVGARNHLSLVVSHPDSLYEWEACRVLLVDDTGFAPVDSARFTGFHYVDWIFDGADIIYAVRTGYRGANTYHNANRMTVKRILNYSSLFDPDTGACTWRNAYTELGDGWCRPTTGFLKGGDGVTDMECAQRCSEAGEKCKSFANDPDEGCALYPLLANRTSGEKGIQCFTKI